MSNITIERAETTVVWDIRDSAHGISTQATFKPFKWASNDHEGFCVSFNGEFAGLDHCWTHPGGDIVAFLRRLNFEYAMGKLIDHSVCCLEDKRSMNDDYFDWLEETFSDNEHFVSELRSEIEPYANPTCLVSEMAEHFMDIEVGTGILFEMQDEYASAYRKYKPKTHYKYSFIYFWENIWPVFIDAVERYMKERAQ